MSFTSIGILGQHTHWLSDNSTIKTRSSHWHWHSETTFRRVLTLITLTLLLLSVRSGTSDHKSKYRCFYPQLSCFYRLIHLLGNAKTLCTFIFVPMSALLLSLTLIGSGVNSASLDKWRILRRWPCDLYVGKGRWWRKSFGIKNTQDRSQKSKDHVKAKELKGR